MNTSIAIDWFRQMLWTAVVTAGPVILAAVVVGLFIAVIQAATQVNDSAASFAPKAFAVLLALIFSGPWILKQLSRFAVEAFTAISHVHP